VRGDDSQQHALFAYVNSEARIPKRHPLRPVRRMVDLALEEMSTEFELLYSHTGRPSIPPEKLLRALLIQILYSIRSERMLIEQLQYNLLFRWFVGLGLDDKIWVPTTFSKNRDRLLAGQLAQVFFDRILKQARSRNLLSDEHFTVDGTLIDAWAGQSSFRPKDPDEPSSPTTPEGDFRGQKRRNDTHQSTTDPQARLFRKGSGKEAKLSFMGHVLMDHRHGLVADAKVTQATGTAERDAGLEMVAQLPGNHRVTVAGDKGYDTRDFVHGLRQLEATPHVAQNTSNRRSAIDGRTTRHTGYQMSQNRRKQVETIFGWGKTVGGMRKTQFRGTERIDWKFKLTNAAYNLVRMRNLEIAACPV